MTKRENYSIRDIKRKTSDDVNNAVLRNLKLLKEVGGDGNDMALVFDDVCQNVLTGFAMIITRGVIEEKDINRDDLLFASLMVAKGFKISTLDTIINPMYEAHVAFQQLNSGRPYERAKGLFSWQFAQEIGNNHDKLMATIDDDMEAAMNHMGLGEADKKRIRGYIAEKKQKNGEKNATAPTSTRNH